ncbi:MAG: TatD family hydrolase [Bacteroidia bacterium]|nr:TatD family hydrolase [Bacteroidia bacterium]
MAPRAIDTHAHLFLEDFDADRAAVTHRARQVCEAVLLPNLDRSTLPILQALVASAPDLYYPMIGIHPTHVKGDYEEELATMKEALAQGRWIAIGEVGMDLYHDVSTRAWQEEALYTQAEWAVAYNLPLSIHFRAALEETLQVLRPFAGKVRGVFHCFTGTYTEAKRILDEGFYLGIGGVLTYKSAQELRDAVRLLPKGSFLLETDSPYLAPVPMRGRRNESSFLSYVIRVLAELRGESPQEVVEYTSAAARGLFGLPLLSAAEGDKPE